MVKKRVLAAVLCLALACALVPLRAANAAEDKSVGDFAGLKAALAGESCTIYLTGDITVPQKGSGDTSADTLVVTAGKTFTLHFNGHNIDCQGVSGYVMAVYGGLDAFGSGRIFGDSSDYAVLVSGAGARARLYTECGVGYPNAFPGTHSAGLKVEAGGTAELYDAILDSSISDKYALYLDDNAATKVTIDYGKLQTASGGASATFAIYKGSASVLKLGADSSAKGGSASSAMVPITEAELTTKRVVYVSRPLPAPFSLDFTNYVATWDVVRIDESTASSYVLQLYKNGTDDATDKCGDPIPVSRLTGSYDFSAAIQAAGVGTYYFKVKAVGNGTTLTDSAWATSPAGTEPLRIIQGANSHWVRGSGKGLRVVSNGGYARFTTLEVDTIDIDESCYTKSEGSTVIVLDAAYLAGLSLGQHTLTFVFDRGANTVSTSFWVDARRAPVPSTGDDTPLLLLGGLILLAGAGLAASAVIRRRAAGRR